MISVVIMLVIPGFGQLAYAAFAFVGAYYLYQADFDWRTATNPPTKTFAVSELSSEQFAEFVRTKLRPQLRDGCIESSKQKFGFQGMVPKSVPQFCDCLARATFEGMTQKEFVESSHLDKMPPAVRERLEKAECSQLK
jgi:hypothetical protein